MSKKIILSAMVATTAICGNAIANENSVNVYADIGLLMLEGREHVFDSAGSNDHLSLLIWQSTAPVLTSGFNVELPDGWTLSAKARVGMGGDSHMEDYDWIAPHATPGSGMNNWSHQSVHPNTSLDWYFDGSIAFGKDVFVNEKTKVNANVGFKYVDVQWSAVDGTYTYSVGGFRDTTGVFAGPAIRYRQQLPSLFAGIDTTHVSGDWTFDIGARAGMTFNAKAIDWHWMRDLRFEETVVPAPTLGASFKATYDISENVDIYFAGDVEKTFLGRSDTTIYQQSTNLQGPTFPNASGAELISGTISFGIRGDLN